MLYLHTIWNDVSSVGYVDPINHEHALHMNIAQMNSSERFGIADLFP